MNTEIEMAEINNNIPNFSRSIEKVEAKKADKADKTLQNENEASKDASYIQDTGVLGRSQIHRSNGANIAKSVDEAVALASKNPVLLSSSEGMFNTMYEDFLAQGMEPSDAYMKALLAEEEFMELGCAYCK